jgi:hypothetical protein
MATSAKVCELLRNDLEDWSVKQTAAWATASGIDAAAFVAARVDGGALISMSEPDFVKLKYDSTVFAQVQVLKEKGPAWSYRAWAFDQDLGHFLAGDALSESAAGQILLQARKCQAFGLGLTGEAPDELYYFVLNELFKDTTGTQYIRPISGNGSRNLVCYTDVRTGLRNVVEWAVDDTILWTIAEPAADQETGDSIQVVYAADTCEITDISTTVSRRRTHYPHIRLLYGHDPPPARADVGGITVTALKASVLYISLRRVVIVDGGAVDMRNHYAECFVRSFAAAAGTVEIYWNSTQREWSSVAIKGSSVLLDMPPQTHQPVLRACGAIWKHPYYDEWSRAPELLQLARDWNLRFAGDGFQLLVSAKMCVGAIDFENFGEETEYLTLKLLNDFDHAFLWLSLRPPSHSGRGVSQVYVHSFFHGTKTQHRNDFDRIMGVIKPVLGRTPMGLLNDVCNVLIACPWAIRPVSIGLGDQWKGLSAGSVNATAVEFKTKDARGVMTTAAGHLTGAYSLRAKRAENLHAIGAFAISSKDLQSVAARAITTYRLGCGDPLIQVSIEDKTVTRLFSSPDADGCLGISFPASALTYQYAKTNARRMEACSWQDGVYDALAAPGLLYVDIEYRLPPHPLKATTSEWSAVDVRVWATGKLLEAGLLIADELKLFPSDFTGLKFAALSQQDLHAQYAFSKPTAVFLHEQFALLLRGSPNWQFEEMINWTVPTVLQWASDIGLDPVLIGWLTSNGIDGSTLAVLDYGLDDLPGLTAPQKRALLDGIARCAPDSATHRIHCSGAGNLGAAGGSNFGWTERAFQIFERIKDDELGAIARWGYYGKLYNASKQLHKGYHELMMAFTDTAAAFRAVCA